MSGLSQQWAWRRYQRGLRTLPVISVVAIVIWAATGAGYFWPGWVLLSAAAVMSIRAMRAMRLGPPLDHDEIERTGGRVSLP